VTLENWIVNKMEEERTDHGHDETERPLENSSTEPNSPTAASISAFSSSSEGPSEHGDARPFNWHRYQDQSGTNDPLPVDLETLTLRDESFYNIYEGRRLCLIFNHKKYKENRLDERNGTDQDVKSIHKTFKSLDFEVNVLNDPTYFNILISLNSVQKESNLSCLALFILTHGEEDGLLHAYDTSYRLNKNIIPELLPTNCPSLAGKPKLIFIQACAGKEAGSGVNVYNVNSRQRHTSSDSSRVASNVSYCIPNHCDLLIFSASYHGQFSFRSSQGSWFIQALCKEIDQASGQEDLNSILLKVSRFVAIHKASNIPSNPHLDKKKQVPLKQDTLIRKIYFKKLRESNDDQNDAIAMETKPVQQPQAVNPNVLKNKDHPNCLCM